MVWATHYQSGGIKDGDNYRIELLSGQTFSICRNTGGVPVSKTGKDHRNIYAGLGKHLGGWLKSRRKGKVGRKWERMEKVSAIEYFRIR